MIECTEKAQELLNHLTIVPPDISAAREFLEKEKLSPEEVTRAGIYYADMCFGDTDYAACDNTDSQNLHIIPNVHSTYICDVIGLLCEFGLEPNGVYDDYNIMAEIEFIDNEYLAADAISILCEHGADIYALTKEEREPFFNSLDFNVVFDVIEQDYRPRFASLVHLWMAAIGYGGRPPKDRTETFRKYNSSEIFDLSELRNHRNFNFSIIHLNGELTISIYDKNTLWEVARFW